MLANIKLGEVRIERYVGEYMLREATLEALIRIKWQVKRNANG